MGTDEGIFQPVEAVCIPKPEECGMVGRNNGDPLRLEKVGSSCACERECIQDNNCMGWTYIPTSLGLKDMRGKDCILHSKYEKSSRRMLKGECNGQCFTSAKTSSQDAQASEDCYDKLKGCAEIKKKGWCDRGQYEKLCRKSCDKCPTITSTTTTTSKPSKTTSSAEDKGSTGKGNSAQGKDGKSTQGNEGKS